jgi:hypothetical protein
LEAGKERENEKVLAAVGRNDFFKYRGLKIPHGSTKVFLT